MTIAEAIGLAAGDATEATNDNAADSLPELEVAVNKTAVPESTEGVAAVKKPRRRRKTKKKVDEPVEVLAMTEAAPPLDETASADESIEPEEAAVKKSKRRRRKKKKPAEADAGPDEQKELTPEPAPAQDRNDADSEVGEPGEAAVKKSKRRRRRSSAKKKPEGETVFETEPPEQSD